jgi:hypothetical protein
MVKRPFVLTDLEDRALAACDDQYLRATAAQAVLSGWFSRSIPISEMRAIYACLRALDLLRTYVLRSGRVLPATMAGHRASSLPFRPVAVLPVAIFYGPVWLIEKAIEDVYNTHDAEP